MSFDELEPLSYDYLVLGLGAEVNFFGVEGSADHAFPLYTLPDAVRLKQHVLRTWEKADRQPALIDDGALNIVVVGGGPTGVETAGALAELYSGVFRKDYPDVSPGQAKITLVEAGPDIFPMFKENLRTYTEEALTKRGVEVQTGEVVESITPQRVTLKSGAVLPAHTLVWGAGLQGNALVQSLGLELERGNRIGVDEELRIPAHPEVYAVGDVAAITDQKTSQVLPQLGSVALQSGEHAGKTIAERIAGKETKPFKYKDKGTMAAIGRGAAVMQMLGGKTVKGKKAQLAWGTVHLALLPTNEDRAKAIVDWAGAGMTHQRSGRITVDLEKESAPEARRERLDRSTLRGARRARARAAAGEGLRAASASRSSTGSASSAGSLTVDKGDVAVSRKNVRADCTLRADKAVFDQVASGKMNAMAATLRGDIAIDGDSELLVPFQRLLPGPPRRRRRVRCHGDRRPASMSDGLIKILDGNTFVVSDDRGDIEASLTDPTGLFSFDTRFLSKWVLSVNGSRLNPLSVDDLQYFETRFFLVPGTGTVYVDSKLSVIRQRAVGNGFHEELTILNHDDKPVDLTVRIDAGCDFADLFEVKDALSKKGKYVNRVEKGRLQLVYERDRYVRSTVISASAPARVDKDGLTFKIKIEPHGTWTTDLDVVTAMLGYGERHELPKFARGRGRQNMQRNLDKWLDDAPRIECDWDPLEATYRRSLVDLAALALQPARDRRREACPQPDCPGS